MSCALYLDEQTRKALDGLVTAAVQMHWGLNQDAAREKVRSGEITYHVSGMNDYIDRWNAWYDRLSSAQVEAYHHVHRGPRWGALCALCRLRRKVTRSEP